MTEIAESRKVRIQNRIITLADARRLASVLVAKYNETKADGKNARIKLSVTCVDESQFDSKSIDLFSDESVIASKRVSSIELSYSSYDSNQEILVSLHHGRSDYQNYVTISGLDSTWVNGTLKKLEEIISGFTPQNQFLTKYKQVLQFVFALGIGSLYFHFIDLIPVAPVEGKPEWATKLASALKGFELLFLLLKYMLAFMVGIWPALYLMATLEKLWPSVEVQIGPEHTFVEKQRRAWMAGAFLVGIVPLLTSVAYDLIKVLVKHAGG
jgi:hypothetical protein